MAQVYYDLAFGVEFDVSAIHGPRRRAFEVDPLSIIAAAMARAFLFSLAFQSGVQPRCVQIAEITKIPSLFRTTQIRCGL
jgi:hypothetical protein